MFISFILILLSLSLSLSFVFFFLLLIDGYLYSKINLYIMFYNKVYLLKIELSTDTYICYINKALNNYAQKFSSNRRSLSYTIVIFSRMISFQKKSTMILFQKILYICMATILKIFNTSFVLLKNKECALYNPWSYRELYR